MAIDRAELFTKVALVQLKTRQAAVLRGSATGESIVCSSFLSDVALITEAILTSAEQFAEKKAETNPEPQYLTEARESFQRAVDEFVTDNTELLEALKD
jgi:hypothetical protein